MAFELPEPLKSEIERLEGILRSVEKPLGRLPGATNAQIAEVECNVGIRFDENLRELLRFSNGGLTLVAITDEMTPCTLAPLSEALEAWSWFLPYDEPVREEWRNEAPCDVRIRPDHLHHRSWFPIAEFNGFSTAVYFDADPAPEGRYGQIIAYQHDPDAAYYVAEGFLAFLRRSNDLLEANLTELLFLDDEFERVCHMSGLAELRRQLAAGLNPQARNWRGHTLIEHAKESGRADIAEFLEQL